MEQPVIAPDGYTYEKRAILQWLQFHTASPKTGMPLRGTQLVDNIAVRNMIIDWLERRARSVR